MGQIAVCCQIEPIMLTNKKKRPKPLFPVNLTLKPYSNYVLGVPSTSSLKRYLTWLIVSIFCDGV